MSSENKGFSLIEVVITIVIVSIAVTGVITVFLTATQKGIDPVLEIKSVELGQALMDEIMLKRYDESTPEGGGRILDPTAIPGPESGETTRMDFDDIDDYHGYTDGGTNPVLDQIGHPVPGYSGFQRTVEVGYFDTDHQPTAPGNWKRIR
ncbi:MAG: prepilin-type N-terminal cleavage/methylation domain-containing protein [Desulfomicrobium escambiense]|nr:prepilin-type N-terminal cleavage/methylation domain-containing protein [Desulfomicrobium escambiense]